MRGRRQAGRRLRRARRRAAGAACVLCGVAAAVAAAPAAAAPADTPYLDAVATSLRQRNAGTENKVWWLSSGNRLPRGWLLQTPDCWGQLNCARPPRGGADFLRRMTQMIGGAQRSVDIAELYQAPDGRFLDAIVSGLRIARQAGREPVVRILIGVYPPRFFAPGTYAKELRAAAGSSLRVQVGYMRSAVTAWNHEKALVVDGRESIIGGMNYWTGDYLTSGYPINDVSMELSGRAADGIGEFNDLMWRYTCASREEIAVAVATAGFDGCLTRLPTLPPVSDPRGVPMMVVGRLGNGINVPGEAGRQAPPIAAPPVSGNKCAFFQRDYSDTNNSRPYEYRNPGEGALRTLIASAKESIFLSQQDLLSCLPKPAIATEAKFDDRLFAVLAAKVAQKVPIKIVLSAGDGKGTGADGSGTYRNGWSLADVADALAGVVQKQQRVSASQARALVCAGVGLTFIHNGPGRAWSSGNRFGNHAKLVAVDDRAFYIGSQNLYPSRLQELGVIVEDGAASAQLKSEYLSPMWRWSSPYALIDPATRRCGSF